MFPEPRTTFSCAPLTTFPRAVILVIILTFVVILMAAGFAPALAVGVVVTAVAAAERQPVPERPVA